MKFYDVDCKEYQQLCDGLKKACSIDPMAPIYYGARQMTTKQTALNTAADLKGQKMRVASDPMPTAFFEALGATPTPVAYNETYLALQQGVADGQENPSASILSMKFYEVQGYLNLTAHQYQMLTIFMSTVSKETEMILLFGLFFVFLFLGMPVAFAMLCSAVLYCQAYGESVNMVLTRTIAGPSSFTLMALAFFILAGNIMNNGGVTDQIFGFCKKVIGWVPGGLGHANVLASVIFAGMSGAAVADAGGLGAIEIKAMRDDGYDDEFSVAVTGASSIIGPIIPPSIPVVVYAVSAGVSVGKLLIGGLVPGLLMAFCMMVYIYFVSKKRHYPRHAFEGFRAVGISFIKSFPALLTPCIILGGILTGICTPTEASAVAVGYALILSLASRNLHLRDLPKILDDTILTTMSVLFIVGCANGFGYIITIGQLPQRMIALFETFISNRYTALLIINLFLFVVGMLMESLSALTLLTPILVPIVMAYGVDPIHFGMVMILNLMIGMLTPPVGMVLFVLSRMTPVPFERICKAMIPFIAMCVISLLVITFVPPLVTWLPTLLLG